MSKLSTILGFSSVMDDFGVIQATRKKEIMDKWEASKNYPRKKKKRIRKELLILWNFACWSPFDDI